MKVLFFILGISICTFCLAQEVPTATQQQLENLASEDIDDDALLQQLDFYHKHPTNLNTASAEELSLLRLLTDLQIASFIRYRSAFGKLIDKYELQAVPGFDLLTIKKILPYVFVGDAQTVKEKFLSRFGGGDQYALLRATQVLEKAKGYDASLTNHYLGSRNSLLFRYRYQYKNLLYYGVVSDKDAGEKFFKGAQRLGFDFYSIHFFARQLGKIRALALGDYIVNLGQGLTQWQSLAFGKSSEIMNIKRQSPVLLPYRSAGEFYFNRGMAATIGAKNLEGTAFLSYKKFSGNLSDSVDRFTSFGTSGYYRTPLEIADRYQLNDLSFGGNLSYQKAFFKVGVNAVMHQFSLPMQKSLEAYNQFAFQGKETFNASVDYSFTYGNAHFFGEAASDKNFHRAYVQGVMVSVDPKVDLSFLYRNIDKAYQSLFGNAFTENALPVNEKGIYTGLQLRPVTGWQIAAYADFYEFPFIKYRVSSPSRGWDYLTQISYAPDKKTEMYLRYRNENKPINETSSGVINLLANQLKQNLRLHYSTRVSRNISVKLRTEMLWFNKNQKSSEEGFLTYMEVACEPFVRLSGDVRLQYFETGSYDSRIYVYESDVLYSFSIPAFFDKGFRYYINLHYEAGKKLSLWLKLAQTMYRDKDVISSGLDELKSPHKTELKLQVKYVF